MSHSITRLLYWSPRILAIAFAVFLSIFALDVFNEAHGVWRITLALAIHLIPSALVVAALIVAWRWELAGAMLFAFLTALFVWSKSPTHFMHWSMVLGIPLPLLVIAGLFLADWIERPKPRLSH
jgi:hypothetical protein